MIYGVPSHLAPQDGREGVAENYDAQEVQVTFVAFSLSPLVIFIPLFILTIFYSNKNAYIERLFYQNIYSVRLTEQNLRLPPSNLCLPLAPDEVPTDDSSLLPRFCVHLLSDLYIFTLLEIVPNQLSAFFSLQPLVFLIAFLQHLGTSRCATAGKTSGVIWFT